MRYKRHKLDLVNLIMWMTGKIRTSDLIQLF